MTLFLPHYGKTLDDVLEAMNGTNWNAAEYKKYQVMLRMPRIETDTNQDLEKIMEQNRQQLNEILPQYSKLAAIRLHEEEFEKTPKKSIKRYLYQ